MNKASKTNAATIIIGIVYAITIYFPTHAKRLNNERFYNLRKKYLVPKKEDSEQIWYKNDAAENIDTKKPIENKHIERTENMDKLTKKHYAKEFTMIDNLKKELLELESMNLKKNKPNINTGAITDLQGSSYADILDDNIDRIMRKSNDEKLNRMYRYQPFKQPIHPDGIQMAIAYLQNRVNDEKTKLNQ